MKNTFKKITAIAAVSLLAVSQVPAANILAKDGVATQEKQQQNSHRFMESQGLSLMPNQERYYFRRRSMIVIIQQVLQRS